MSSDEEYRRQAADAERQARLAKNDSDRESWLRIAQGWMSLLRKRPQSNEEAFVAGHAAGPLATMSPRRRQEVALGVAGAAIVGAVVAVTTVLRRRSRRTT